MKVHTREEIRKLSAQNGLTLAGYIKFEGISIPVFTKNGKAPEWIKPSQPIAPVITQAALQQAVQEVRSEVRRGRGRPPGSKNKRKK